jgi:hypothetical protein
METRNVQLSLEMAKKWFEGDNTELKDLAVQTYPELAKKQLPKSWEELGEISGAWVDVLSAICTVRLGSAREANRRIFATKEQAEAYIAMAQLSQLMKVYNDGWVADYKDNSNKYCICFYEDEARIAPFLSYQCFLRFKNEQTAELFLENFRDLIEQAKPLL